MVPFLLNPLWLKRSETGRELQYSIAWVQGLVLHSWSLPGCQFIRAEPPLNFSPSSLIVYSLLRCTIPIRSVTLFDETCLHTFHWYVDVPFCGQRPRRCRSPPRCGQVFVKWNCTCCEQNTCFWEPTVLRKYHCISASIFRDQVVTNMVLD